MWPRPESLPPACEQCLLWSSVGKRAMLEDCAVDCGTIPFICISIQWKLPVTCHSARTVSLWHSYKKASVYVSTNGGHEWRGESFGGADLTEDDIPCAAIAVPLESHTVPVLKWWLVCHCIHTCDAWFHLFAYEILVSIVVFCWDC